MSSDPQLALQAKSSLCDDDGATRRSFQDEARNGAPLAVSRKARADAKHHLRCLCCWQKF